MTVSNDELMELLQVIEAMIVLGDVECASSTVWDWIRAHPGEARVIQNMGRSEDLFSHMTLDMSNLMRYALNSAYILASVADFRDSKSKMDRVILELSRPGTPNRPPSGSCVWIIMKLFVSSLCANATPVDQQYGIRVLKIGKGKTTNEFFADEVRKIVIWNREQYLAQQATVRTLMGDFKTAIRALSLLKTHLEDMNERVASDDLYVYTGLPYAPGPGEEL